MDENKQVSIDRRNFLKGAALVGAGALSAGALAACSPSTTPASSEVDSTGGSTGSVSGTIGGAICPEDWLGTMPTITDAED
ncbi:MAG: twin-arginine translocation signal domain-containing protein, partial [Coriobacteriales bacterium]|nr:twin-arginine translocation signal domain-containing protein [Coriobacteriales bacterium]